MPSPFPGMDPFLEDPDIFRGVQLSMAVHLSAALQQRLPEPYYSDLGVRAWVEFPCDETRETSVEIFARHDEEILVTVIEILSPANKTPGQYSRELYLQRQRQVLDSGINLVEIDLLRAGEHTTTVPLDVLLAWPGLPDYHVCIRPMEKPDDRILYAISLKNRLPQISIPLLPGDAPIVVDLQEVFDRCYKTGPYKRRLRYHIDSPVPPLRPEQVQWATELLRTKGLLPAAPSP